MRQPALHPGVGVVDVLQVPSWDGDCAPQEVLKVALSGLPGVRAGLDLHGGSSGIVCPPLGLLGETLVGTLS